MVAAAGALLVAAGAGCGLDLTGWLSADAPPDFSHPRDLGIPQRDLVFPWEEWNDFGGEPPPPRDPCEVDRTCRRARYAPPFPLQSDEHPDPLEKDNGVNADINGYLKLYITNFFSSSAWIANTQDANSGGTVSRVDTKTMREVARYPSVTCSSLKTGSTAPCDGVNGCCSLDDADRYAARSAKMPEPGHQAVQRTANQPSRTTVDFNMDVLVANRAAGGQASLTRISADISNCVDRNHNGKINTSADTNGDGWIEVDCNGDGVPDDIAGVQGKPCSNGLKQEFYGLDDECVVWTTNLFAPGARATAVGLGSGAGGASDPWVASPSGQVVRVDGATAKIKADTALPADCTMASGPWGLAIDAAGVAWVTEKGAGKLCWFDTKNAPYASGVVRDPQWGPMVGDGITMDRDQNVWVGGGMARYTADRTNGLKNLGMGWWMRVDGVTGMGIVADSRNAQDYFTYACQGASVLQIPASKLKVMKADQTVMNPGWPAIQMPCTTVAADANNNIVGIDAQITTRALVDIKGAITQPSVKGMPMGNNKCPAGDSCPNMGAEAYSDLTTFALRGFIRPSGTYTMLVRGCTDGDGNPADTQWGTVEWDADVPPNTSIVVHARSSDGASYQDLAWSGAQWTPDGQVSPFDLFNLLWPNYMPGAPQGVHDGWLMVEFVLKTSAQNASPKLKSFTVTYFCPVVEG